MLPWMLVDAYNPVDPAERSDDIAVRFFCCRGCSEGCSQVWEVPVSGVGSIQSNMIRHIKNHFSSSKIGAEDDSKNTKGPLPPSSYEFVARWLASGYAHYQVTRHSNSGLYNFLKTTNCPVVSPNTFDLHRDRFLELTIENMLKGLSGQVGFIMGDSSPDRLKREWISWGVSFIDDQQIFHYMPLGLNQAKGRLTSEAYSEHHDAVCSAWEIKETLSVSDEPLSNLKTFTLVGAGSDMGPGLRQVYQNRYGGPELHYVSDPLDLSGDKLVMFGPCASHGIVNIQKAALALGADQPIGSASACSPAACIEELSDLIKLLQRRCTLENAQSALNLAFPRIFQNKKWTGLRDTLQYLLKEWPKLQKLEGTNLDIVVGTGYEEDELSGDDELYEVNSENSGARRWNWNATFQMLTVFEAVMEPLCTLSVQLQKVGPLDGYVMVNSVVKALSALHRKEFFIHCMEDDKDGVTKLVVKPLQVDQLEGDQREVYDELVTDCTELIKRRLVRRFFYNSIGRSIGQPSWTEDGEADRTVKYDYLQCTTVLCLFALSPDCGFNFLVTLGIATEAERSALEKRSKDALWLMYQLVKGTMTHPPVVVTANAGIKRQRQDLISTSDQEEVQVRAQFFAQVALLTSNKELRNAQVAFDASAESREDRQAFFKKWHAAASKVNTKLAKLLQICGAQMFSNAVGESNFATVSRLLSDQRLKTGKKLLAAQLLGARATKWAQFTDTGKSTSKKEKKAGILAFFPVGKTEGMDKEDRNEDEEMDVPTDNVVIDVTATPNSELIRPSQETTAKRVSIPLPQALSSRPQRASAGRRMNAVLNVIYGVSRGTVSSESHPEPLEEEDVYDPEYSL